MRRWKRLHGVVVALVATSCMHGGTLHRSAPTAVRAAPPELPPEETATEPGDVPDAPDNLSLPRPRLLWRRTGMQGGENVNRYLGARTLVRAGSAAVSVPGLGLTVDAHTGNEIKGAREPKRASPGFKFEGHTVRVKPHRATQTGWTDTDVAADGKAFSEPVVVDSRVYLLKPREVVVRDAASGRLIDSWPLPAFLEPNVRDGATKLILGGGRFVVMDYRRGIIVTGVSSSRDVTSLYDPMSSANDVVVLGDVMVFLNTYSGHLEGYDLTAPTAPLLSLSPEEAIAKVKAESDAFESVECHELARLPQLEPLWLDIARKPEDPLWHCAMRELERHPRPGAGKLLRALANQSPQKSDDHYRLLPFSVRVLAADDDLETTRWLTTYFKKLESAKEYGELNAWEEALLLTRDQLWRTGRTADMGFCPETPSPRHLDDLDRRAADGSIGTPHPLLFRDIAPDGRWSLICQARTSNDGIGPPSVSVGRHGDLHGATVVPYLVKESGPGWTFDEFIGSDPTGRYVAVREGACLTIADATSATAVTLPNADLRDDGRFGRHRAVAFDDTGTRLLFLRNGRSHEVVMRDLASGAESTVNAGAGLVWSARFARGRQGLVLHVIPSGEWPGYVTSLAPRSCRGPVTSFTSFGPGATSRPIVRLLPLSGGHVIEGDDIVAPFAGRALARRKNGALVMRDADGGETRVAPASCGGLVQHLDSARGVALVACSKRDPAGKVALWMYGPNGRKELGAIYATANDDLSDTGERVVAVGDAYVDVEEGRIVPTPRLARATVRVTRTWEEREAGHFAERWDGAVLTQDEQGDYTVPPGPLRWRRP